MAHPSSADSYETRPRWDVAIVLGASLRPDGQPSRALERRIRRGVELIRAGLVIDLILTGGGEGERSEASAMAEIATLSGIPPERIHLDPLARNTLENAVNAIAIARERGWKRGVVVTDSYHLPRACMAFRQLGWSVSGVGSASFSLGQLVPAMRELAAFPAYMIRLEQKRRALARTNSLPTEI